MSTIGNEALSQPLRSGEELPFQNRSLNTK